MKIKFKKHFAVVALVAVLLLAGCTGDGDRTAGGEITPTTEPDVPDDADSTDAPDLEAPSNRGDGSLLQRHASAVETVGSYTLEYTFNVSSGPITATQQVDVETGERYVRTSQSATGDVVIEYYQPPNTDVAYQHFGGQTQEVPASDVATMDLGDFENEDASATLPSGIREDGTENTALGPATRYVIDSVEAFPADAYAAYDSVEDVRIVVLVDQATGVVAGYDYEMTYVLDGTSETVGMEFAVTELGTTIQQPSWVP